MEDNLISLQGTDSLDLEIIKDNLKQYLLNEDVIKDVNYEGSNIALLINLVSYAVYNVNANSALRSKDVLLTTSSIRENIIEIAKELSYEITRSISSKLEVSLSYTLGAGESITIPKHTKFDVGLFIFSTTDDVLLTEAENTKIIDLIEGTFIDKIVDSRLNYVISEKTRAISIPYRDIENDNISITLTRATNGTINLSKTTSLLDLDGTNFYEDYDTNTGYVNIIFNYANIGIPLDSGDTLDVEFLATNGSIANGYVECIQKDSIVDNSDNNVDLTIAVVSASRNGQDEESDEDIKANAPVFYNTGNRTVNAHDYKAFLNKTSLVDTSNAWGFESMPSGYFDAGTAYLSVVPQDVNQDFLLPNDIIELLEILSPKRIISTYRKYMNPVYIYLDLDIKIIGDVYNLADKQTKVTEKFDEMYNQYLSKFDGYLYYSKIVRELENIFLEDNATVKITLKPFFRMSTENFDYTSSGSVLFFVPDSERRRYLTKDSVRIDYPTDVYLASDLKLNGWVETVEPTEQYAISFEHAELTMVGNDLVIASSTVGTWDATTSMIVFNSTYENLIKDKDIYITYDDLINVKYLNNTYFKKGTISYV